MNTIVDIHTDTYANISSIGVSNVDIFIDFGITMPDDKAKFHTRIRMSKEHFKSLYETMGEVLKTPNNV